MSITLTPALWPPKYPNAVVDQTYDVSQQTTLYAEVVSLNVATGPTGTGALAVTSVSYAPPIATVTVEAGQPGITYTALFSAGLPDGEILQWEVQQPVLAYPLYDLGPPVVWSAGLPLPILFAFWR